MKPLICIQHITAANGLSVYNNNYKRKVEDEIPEVGESVQ